MLVIVVGPRVWERDKITAQGMWAPFQKQLFFDMYQNGLFDMKILSVGCGPAHNESIIESLIQKTESKGSIICTDKSVPKVQFCNVLIHDGVEAVTLFPSDVLYLSWPDYCARWPTQALNAFSGKYVVYIGESRWGCTANEDFYDELESGQWERIDKSTFEDQANWYGIRCFPSIYKRR
jgi:hypothetical protein